MALCPSSSISTDHLRGLCEGGFIFASCEGHAPNNHHVCSSLAAFHERGLCLLVHIFLCGLLIHYSLELRHLTPGGVLHVAVFITLCEAFLGFSHILCHGSISSTFVQRMAPIPIIG
jgi:hypothetical protein